MAWCREQFGPEGTRHRGRWFARGAYRTGWASSQLTLFFRNSEDAVLFSLSRM